MVIQIVYKIQIYEMENAPKGTIWHIFIIRKTSSKTNEKMDTHCCSVVSYIHMQYSVAKRMLISKWALGWICIHFFSARLYFLSFLSSVFVTIGWAPQSHSMFTISLLDNIVMHARSLFSVDIENSWSQTKLMLKKKNMNNFNFSLLLHLFPFSRASSPTSTAYMSVCFASYFQ